MSSAFESAGKMTPVKIESPEFQTCVCFNTSTGPPPPLPGLPPEAGGTEILQSSGATQTKRKIVWWITSQRVPRGILRALPEKLRRNMAACEKMCRWHDISDKISELESQIEEGCAHADVMKLLLKNKRAKTDLTRKFSKMF